MSPDDELEAMRASNADLERRLAEANTRLNAAQQQAYELESSLSVLSHDHALLQANIEHLWAILKSSLAPNPGEMCVRPRLGPAHLRTRRNVGFIIMPFATKWAERVDAAVTEALKRKGMQCQRADRMAKRDIMRESWERMCEAGVVIADITGSNRNVMYELGLADTAGLDIILIGQSAHPKDLPFDLLGDRVLVYSPDDLEKLTEQLACKIDSLRHEQDARAGRRH